MVWLFLYEHGEELSMVANISFYYFAAEHDLFIEV